MRSAASPDGSSTASSAALARSAATSGVTSGPPVAPARQSLSARVTIALCAEPGAGADDAGAGDVIRVRNLVLRRHVPARGDAGHGQAARQDVEARQRIAGGRGEQRGETARDREAAHASRRTIAPPRAARTRSETARSREIQPARAMMSQTARIAAPREVERRQAAPITRFGAGGAKGPHGEAARGGEGTLRREPRQEREAEAGRDHLPQRLEAGRAKVLLFRADAFADLERLVAQAMAFLEQQELLAREVGRFSRASWQRGDASPAWRRGRPPRTATGSRGPSCPRAARGSRGRARPRACARPADPSGTRAASVAASAVRFVMRGATRGSR